MTDRTAPRLVLVALLISALAIPAAASADDAAPRAPSAAGLDDYRPDGWIKLCGLSTGCVINPLPNPTRGKDVYNTTGRRQKVAVRMEDGEGVRFWIALQNDGALADRVTVNGCNGTPRFVINAVLVGKHKRPSASARKITKAFKQGTAAFDLAKGPQSRVQWITLNIVAPTTAEGVTYRCPVTITSQGQPAVRDTVLAVMTTY